MSFWLVVTFDPELWEISLWSQRVTLTALVIAQVTIITPVIASIAHQSMRELWAEYHDLLISINATKWQRIRTLIWDGCRNLLTAALAGFGRAIGEVGAIMIVGGISNMSPVF